VGWEAAWVDGVQHKEVGSHRSQEGRGVSARGRERMGLEAVSAEPDRQRVARRDAARVDAAAHLGAREAHAVAAPAVVLVGEAQQGEQALQEEGGGRAAADAPQARGSKGRSPLVFLPRSITPSAASAAGPGFQGAEPLGPSERETRHGVGPKVMLKASLVVAGCARWPCEAEPGVDLMWPCL